MQLFKQLLLSSWNTFYGFSGGDITHHKGSTTSLIDDNFAKAGKYYVENCYFDKLKTNTDGSAICIKKGQDGGLYTLLIESCTFLSCRAEGGEGLREGGAIAINIKGDSILAGICAYECTSDKHCQFAKIAVDNVNTRRNEVYQSSITRSVSDVSTNIEGKIEYLSILNLNNGAIRHEEINGTHCFCTYNTFYFNPSDNKEKYPYIGRYSTFADNELQVCVCLRFDNQDEHVLVQKCNVIRNKQKIDAYDGIIMGWAMHLTIEDSCIYDNVAKHDIDAHGGTIEKDVLHEGSIVLINCFIDKDKKINNDRNEKNVFYSKTPKNTFINNIICFSTAKCEASYDVISKGPICYTKSLIDLPFNKGMTIANFAMIILPAKTKLV